MAQWNDDDVLLYPGTDGHLTKIIHGVQIEDSGVPFSLVTMTNNFIAATNALQGEINTKVATNETHDVAIGGDVTIGLSSNVNTAFSTEISFLVAGLDGQVKESGFYSIDTKSGWAWAYGWHDYGLTRLTNGVLDYVWLFHGDSKDMDVNGNSITNIGLSQSTSLKVSATGAIVTNTSNDSTSTDAYTLLTANAGYVARTNAVGVYSNNVEALAYLQDGDTLATGLYGPNAIATNQYVNKQQLDSVLVGNVDIYLTSTKEMAFTNSFGPTNDTYKGACSQTNIGPLTTLTISSQINGAYLFGFGCTNKSYTRVSGQSVKGVVYISENAAGFVIGKVEVYRRDTITGDLEEWGDGGDVFTLVDSATPQRTEFSVPVVGVTTNNAFEIWARFKRTAGTASGVNLLVGCGTGMVSRISFTVASDILLEGYQTVAGYQAGTGTLYNAFKEEHRSILIQDPTNGVTYWCENPFGAPATVSDVYVQTIGVTGLVDVIRRDRSAGWETYTTVATGLVADVTGVSTVSTRALTNNQYIGAVFSGLNGFNITNRIMVEFQIDRN